MYLKSIEVQGFKSFANKILFEFNNGITGIVGPNGSGKSNVADAVRWVLGEQSAKQLRGAKMEDIIFAGTQLRKPLGFAYVAITMDNSDHALAVDYDEVTVSRRVFRSGESEYMINGNNCRLKDVAELFYDTGIGKEGYSIIGQGQIDKILSGKPEERRELFDEAAGIVKFKKRKAASIKKLENERANLVRVNDILAELEKQVGPLEKQSQKAKQYLNYKEELKVNDVNAFLLETDAFSEQLEDLEKKIVIATNDLAKVNEEYESTKIEYENVQNELSNIQNDIEMLTTLHSNTEVEKGRMMGQINLLNEQIKTIEANSNNFKERIEVIKKERERHLAQLETFNTQKAEINKQLEEVSKRQNSFDSKSDEIESEIEKISSMIEEANQKMLDILNEKTNIKTQNQRYETLLEQINIRKAELNSEVIKGKTAESAQIEVINNLSKEVNILKDELSELNNSIKANENKIIELKEVIANYSSENDKLSQQYHREKSKLEALRNIAEKYDGYGNSIKKVMECKENTPGILGVVADIVKVQKQYEVAIETALGGTIQNIVTDNEGTAKKLINYLKENKFGRATFLPLSSISGKNTIEKDSCMNEPGVVGVASKLVRVSFEYENLVNYLLGRILVVDNIDNALAIAKKYKYSLRIVTLEGEQLNPGGSMTGGAFKNSSNLLGRRREIEELKENVSRISKELETNKEKLAQTRKELAGVRDNNELLSKSMREKQLLVNTANINYNQALAKKDEIVNSYKNSADEAKRYEDQIKDIQSGLGTVNDSLSQLDSKNEGIKKDIEKYNIELENSRKEQTKHLAQSESVNIQIEALNKQVNFIDENITRIDWELENLSNEENTLNEKIENTVSDIALKNEEIETLKKSCNDCEKQCAECKEKLETLKTERDNYQEKNKTFFDKREKLSTQINAFDKECYRLNSSKEKIQNSNDAIAEYMWSEYEITYSVALELKDEKYNDLNALKKNIMNLKANIKALGDVNVNSIEEFKDVSERYTFLKNQHDDLINAENELIKIIDELDNGMKTQFKAKFEEIKVEFNKVFKEMFGGGQGSIEISSEEDILEAAITIVSQPPGKKLQNMMQLSGGEKALTAIALLFAIQNLKPSPFCLLDEIEAALDDSNVDRYASYLHKLTKHTQFIVITHRRGTMAQADRLYGITMQEKGVSTLVSVDLIENELDNTKK